MSDMTIEKAHLELNLHRSDGPDCGCLNCAFAWGFLEGHASRDPEVADLKAKIEKMEAHDEKIRTAIGDAYSADIDREREASRKLVEAAIGLRRTLGRYHQRNETHNFGAKLEKREYLCEGCGAMLEWDRIATPGHSPEGKDVA